MHIFLVILLSAAVVGCASKTPSSEGRSVNPPKAPSVVGGHGTVPASSVSSPKPVKPRASKPEKPDCESGVCKP